MKAYHGAQNGSDEAHAFDRFLKKLETTKHQQPSQRRAAAPAPRPRDPGRYYRQDSSDNSTFDSRNESAFGETTDHTGFFEEVVEGRRGQSQDQEQRLFETRQRLVDREGPTCDTSVDSFIERAQSGTSGSQPGASRAHSGDAWYTEGGGLPDAILKLDRRQAIPTPRHKNDVLVEIEASTVDRRELMVRPGVRCTDSLPQGVETVAPDCIGRVVQVTTHARAIHGIAIDDRVAAIFPFEYKDGCKDKGRRNKRYALVDAGLVVAVPKHVDASDAACMVRLYMTAFQAVRLGLGSVHDRYDFNQLKGKSILVQNGLTELGRAIIDLAGLLGAERIFATGPTEQHQALVDVGAIPLGKETFSWELFIEEKLSVVLVQEMPTTENFEQFISILDETGNMVYIQEGHGGDELGLTSDDVNCELLNLKELAKRVRGAMNSAKFDMLLACTPRYLVYEGVWRSCKENQSQFKEDLRYLFTLLGQGGGLKPNVIECVGLEEISGVQDRIELLGKKGSIVCLPTALYERKVLVSPENSKRDQPGFPGSPESGANLLQEGTPVQDYASDAGYVVKSTPAHDTLSDFHRMQDSTKSTRENTDNLSAPNLLLPVLPESSSFHKSASSEAVHTPLTRRDSYGFSQECDAYSAISSIGHSSPSNQDSQTTMSEGALGLSTPFSKLEPPTAIKFRSKESRRNRAFEQQKRAKERRRLQQQKKDATEKNEQAELQSLPSQDKSVSSAASSARRLRRETRTGGHNGVTAKRAVNGRTVDISKETRTTPEVPVKKASSATNPDVHKAIMVKKMSLRSQAIQKKASLSPKADGIEHRDSRDEGESVRDGNPTTSKSASFNKLISQWEGMSQQESSS